MIVENLEFEVTQTGLSAAQALDSLTNSLKRLSGALSANKLEKFSAQLHALNSSLSQIDESNVSRIERLARSLSSLKTGNVSVGLSAVAKNSKVAGNNAKHASKGFGELASSLKRIAMYRVLRTIIKEIGQAFQEGLKNAYLFSAGINTEGHRFASAMDSIKSAGTQMKNQLGSAFIGLLAAIEPIIVRLANIVTYVADLMSQFFSAFTGKTYLKASSVADKFADTMKKGGKAAKEWKNQLMSFDEINRLNEPSDGGSGGGSAALDPSQMFEDTPIDDKIKSFADKIKSMFKEIELYVHPSLERLKGAMDRLMKSFSATGMPMDFLEFFFDLTKVITTGLIDGVTLLADAITLLVDAVNGLRTGDWSNFFEDMKRLVDDLNEALGDLVYGGMLLFADAIDAIAGTSMGDTLRKLKEGTELVDTATDHAGMTEKDWSDAMVIAQAKMNGSYAAAKKMATANGETGVSYSKLADTLRSVHIPSFHFDGWQQYAFNVFGSQQSISLPRISWYAKGGVVDGASLIGAGEAGAEAIVPLENNTEWLDMIADRLIDAMGSGSERPYEVKVYLDSKQIRAGQQRLNRAMGV